MKKNSVLIYITAAIWAAVCFLKVQASADPSGGDGYFYLKQTEWLADHFSFYHADYSLIFFPLAFIYKLTGSSLLAFQLVTSLSLFGISAALGFIFYENLSWVKKDDVRIFVSSFVTILLAMQASLLKLSYEFAKNGLAQAFLMWGLYFYFSKKTRRSLIFFGLAALTHKLAFLVVALGLFFYLLGKNRKAIAGIAVFIAVASAAMFAIFPRLTKHFTNFIEHFAVEKIFFLQIENQLMTRLLMVLTFIWLCFAITKLKHLKDPVVFAMIAFAFAPFLPIYSGYNIEIKYRLFLLSFTFGAALFAMSVEKIRHHRLQPLALLLSLAVLAYQAPQYNGFPWIMNWSQKLRNLDQLEARVQPGDEVVTQHGLQFYIDYKTKIRARSMVASNRKPKYQIAYTPDFYHLNDELSDEIHQIEIVSLGGSYGLFQFDDFQALMRQYPMLSDWRNQFQVRPEFVQDY